MAQSFCANCSKIINIFAIIEFPLKFQPSADHYQHLIPVPKG